MESQLAWYLPLMKITQKDSGNLPLMLCDTLYLYENKKVDYAQPINTELDYFTKDLILVLERTLSDCTPKYL